MTNVSKIEITANIISLIGSVIMIFVGLIKNKKKILGVQIVMFALFAVANVMLGAVTGAVTNGLSIIRNGITFFTEFGLPYQIGFICVQATLCLLLNNGGLIGWLPVLGVGLFTLTVNKSAKVMKAVIIVTQIMWTVYDLFYKNYSAAIFDVVTMVSNAVGIYLILRDEKKAKEAGKKL